MRRIKILMALALGVVASSSGILQVKAATYNFSVDFSTKEVADFTAFNQSFNVDTYDLDARINFFWQGTYRFDSCPTSFTINNNWIVYYRLLPSPNVFTTLGSVNLPDFTCTTTNTSYIAQASLPLPDNMIDYLMNDDDKFIRFTSLMFMPATAATNGRTLSLLGYSNYFDISYDFNTTYLFNKFLSDQKFGSRTLTGGTWNATATPNVRLSYVYTTAGNDSYYLNNSGGGLASIGSTRKRYAIDYNNEFFRGESVGAQFRISYTGTDTNVFPGSGAVQMFLEYDYFFLNTANLAQAIVDAPIIGFTEEVCSGGFLDINVGCYVNNALAYIVNDAPIISDAFTLLNTGIELAAQTFGIIGNFSDDNVFGYLILVGFGFIAVKWFLKNDD
jgi:hypothetical protein